MQGSFVRCREKNIKGNETSLENNNLSPVGNAMGQGIQRTGAAAARIGN